ncbi:MAG: hypothetical protein ACI8Z1_003938 [Candidatus Azotimanducaceae bacterium]|jgi:hypothetical protein
MNSAGSPNSNPAATGSSAYELRSFGRSLAALIVIFFGLVFPYLMNFSWPIWPWLIALPLWVVAEVSPTKLNKVQFFWLRLGELMGQVTTPIVLGLVFFLLLTPIGWLKRTLGASKIDRKLDPLAESYRTKVSVESDMSDPF